MTEAIPLNSRIALSIHAYYLDIFEEILEKIPRSFPFFDIFVTCPESNEVHVRALLEAHNLEASILICPNRGMDVVPFLVSVRYFELYRYVAIVKLHTKNNKDANGTAISSEILERILANHETLYQLRDMFLEGRLDIAGPEYLYKNADFMMYNNRKLFTAILKNLGMNPTPDVGFFAGTMFWIRGRLLESLAAQLPTLLDFYDCVPLVSRTGSDGSLAHAIERVWCALADDRAMKTGLIYPADNTGRGNIIRVASQSDAIHEPLRRSAVTDLIGILPGSASAAGIVATSELFNSEYYLSRPGNAHNPGVMPALHYVLYGEPLGIRPSPNFNPAYYGLRRQDVLHARTNFLAHYVNFGKREGMIANPNYNDWLAVAEKTGFFDPNFYASVHPHSISVYGGAHEHYRCVGRHLCAPTSKNFAPSTLPVLAEEDGIRDYLSRYLDDFRTDESYRYHELARLVQNNDFVTLRRAADEIVERYGTTAPIQIAAALHAVAVGDIAKAGRELEAFWHDLTTGISQRRHINRLTSYLRRLTSTAENWPRSGGVGRLGDKRVCVYTTLFGEIDDLPPVLSRDLGIDFICFTDRKRASPGWEYRVCAPEFASENLSAKTYKILPHLYLGDYEYSMFLDANTLIVGRLKQFIADYLLGRHFAMWTHPERTDPYVEMCAIVEAERHSPAKLVTQMLDYQKDGLPHEAEMYEASFIWRRHGQPEVIQFMEAWWKQIIKYSARDQLSLSYLSWKTGFEPAKIDSRFGTSRDNTVFFKLPHLKTDDKRPREGSQRTTFAARRAARKIQILYSDKYVNAGSNVLRARQMYELVKKATDEDVVYSPNEVIFNTLVIATKGYIADRGAEGLQALKERGNLVFLDLVDRQPTQDVVAIADGLIASSIQAMKLYRSAWISKPCFHVTHHVDFRLQGRWQNTPKLKVGYFGELLNTVVDEDIARLVDFDHVDTSRIDLGWMGRIGNYNCHYAVRKSRSIDGPKPFLKGFVAAEYRSNIIIQRDAGDAEYYLGPDYPYLLEAKATPHEIIDMLHYVRESYGGPEWRLGLLTMRDVRRRSSNAFVVREIKEMLKQISILGV